MAPQNPLRDSLSNVDILNAIRNQATNDYYRRVPAATQGNITDTINELWKFQPTRNEFVDALVNRIGLEIGRFYSWQNPLAKFKIDGLPFGDTIEEYIVGLLEAKTYDANRDALEQDLFGQARIDVQTSFHKVNRQDQYKISVNQNVLKRAFLSENGLATFVAQLMEAPNKSDQWDEFLTTTRLFREYHDAQGYFIQNVPDLTTATADEADAKYFLRRVREMADTLTFISGHYNASGMPVAAARDELELFITPNANAAIDVEALAAAFNEDRANMPMRTTVIPQEHFNIPGAQAILTTRDFFVISDQLYETRSLQNPSGLYDNYWLHHWQVQSASRFVPAVLYSSTEQSDVITINDTPVTGAEIEVQDREGTVVTSVERGGMYNVVGNAVTTPEGGVNSAVRLNLSGQKSQYTYLTVTGALVIGADEESGQVTVVATSVDDPTFSATVTVNVTGDRVQVWPDPTVVVDTDNDGLLEVTPIAVPAAPTSGTSKNKVPIPDPEPEGSYDYKDGSTIVNGQTLTLTANKTITAAAKPGYEFADGATTSWNLVYTA